MKKLFSILLALCMMLTILPTVSPNASGTDNAVLGGGLSGDYISYTYDGKEYRSDTAPSAVSRMASNSVTDTTGITSVEMTIALPPAIYGNSVYRNAADTATVRFLSATTGTCYYTVTDSEVSPTAATLETDGIGAIAVAGTNAIDICGMESGAKWVHIVVNDGNEFSNVLSVPIPYDVYYHEDFESYPVNTYVAQSGNPMLPLTQVNGGTRDIDQKVVDDSGKYLSLTSNSFASDQVVSWAGMIPSTGMYIFEGDVRTPVNDTSWQLRFALQRDFGETNNNTNEAGVFINGGKIVATSDSNRELLSSYDADTWYKIKIVTNADTGKYSVYINDVLKADDLTLPSGITRAAISAGHNKTANFDNLVFYKVAAPDTYTYNTPVADTKNGVTATVNYTPTVPQEAGTSVTATVTLTGTATAAGTHSINLTSIKAGLNGTAQTASVTAGQNLTAAPVTKTFTFAVPAEDTDDMTLTHTFSPAHIHPVCGAGCSHTANHTDVTWHAVTLNGENQLCVDGTVLASFKLTDSGKGQYYYLAEDIQLPEGKYLNGSYTSICLNGHTLTGADGQYSLNGYNTTLCDCIGTGCITHQSDATGAGINSVNYPVTLYGGKISGNEVGVFVNAASSNQFYLYGGEIGGNRKGGIQLRVGTLYMYGGVITNNGSAEITDSFGGVTGGSSSCISGGRISGNIAYSVGGGVNSGGLSLSGNPVIDNNYICTNTDAEHIHGTGCKESNIYLAANDTVRLTGALTDGANIGIRTRTAPTLSLPVTVNTVNGSHMVTEADTAYIHSDNTAYSLTVTDGVLRLYIPVTYTVTGSSVYRSAAETATVRYISDIAGTAYYTVTDSITAPTASELEANGTSAPAVIEANVINLTAMTSGAKYLHITVKDSSNRFTNVLTVAMPYDIYFFDDFESYAEDTKPRPVNTTVLPIHQVGGYITSAGITTVESNGVSTKTFLANSGYGDSSYRGVLQLPIPAGVTSRLIVEMDVYTGTKAGSFAVTNASQTSLAGLNMNQTNYLTNAAGQTSHDSDTARTVHAWQHIKLDINVARGCFDYYIDNEKKNDTPLLTGASVEPLFLTFTTNYSSSENACWYDNIHYSSIPSYTVTGNSVYRDTAQTATVRFMSYMAGTCYYQVTDSATAPTASEILAAGDGVYGNAAVIAGSTNTISLTGMESGAQWVHIVVKDSSNRYSNVLTVAMPNDVYYFDDFDSYPVGTVGDNTSLSFTYGTKYAKTVYNDSNAIWISANYDSGREPIQYVALPTDTNGLITLETKIKPADVNGGTGSLYLYDNVTKQVIASVSAESDRKWRSAAYGQTGTLLGATDDGILYTVGTWYTVRIEYNTAANTYDVYIDNVKANTAPLTGGGARNNYALALRLYDSGWSANSTFCFDDVKLCVYNNHDITVTNGTASTEKAVIGTDITLTADAAPEVKHFSQWNVISGGVTLDNPKSTTAKFTMPDCTVSVEAVYVNHTAESTGWKTDTANHWHECSCGNIIDTAAHSFTWITDTFATEDVTGMKHEECTVCNFRQNEGTVIDKLPHTHAWTEIPAKTSTCLVQGNNQYFYCTKCEKYYKADKTTRTSVQAETLPLGGHSYGTLIAEIPATHSKPGTEAHYKCAVCSRLFDTVKKEITEKSLVIAVISHSYGSWRNDATSHWHECSCGVKKDTAKHSFTWITDKAATTDSTGLKHEKCTVCGYKRNIGTVTEKLPIPKITVTPTPEIALNSNHFLVTVSDNGLSAIISSTGGKTIITEADGTPANINGKLKTGMKVIMKSGNKTVDEITIVVLGDVDCDGIISAADARLALRQSVRLENLSGAKLDAVRVNGNTVVSAADARLILRASVKLEQPVSWISSAVKRKNSQNGLY